MKKKPATGKPKPQPSVKVKDLSAKKDPTGGRKASGKPDEY